MEKKNGGNYSAWKNNSYIQALMVVHSTVHLPKQKQDYRE